MTVAPQADTETVTGIVQGVVAKAADKWQVEVNVGQQNPRRLWTKDPELVQQMMGLIGQTLSFMCGKSHWTNNSGQPVTSLWINGYGQPGAIAPAPQPVTPQSVNAWQQPLSQVGAEAVQYQQPGAVIPTMPQPVPLQSQRDVTEDKIHRQTATKVAAQLLKHLTPENQTFDNLLRISEKLVAYYDNGVAWQEINAADPGPEPGLSPDDDQIPF